MSKNGRTNGKAALVKRNKEAIRNEKARQRVLNDPLVKAEIEKAYREADEQMEALGENSAIAGIVGGDGNFVSTSNYFSGPGIEAQWHGNTQVVNVSKGAQGTDDAAGESRGISESEEDSFDPDNTIPPPWSFDALQSLLVTNTIHSAAVETKAADYAYSGWRLNRVPEVTRMIEESQISEDEVVACEEEVRRFLDTLLQGKPVEDFCRDIAIDFETIGVCNFEVVRKKSGLLDSVYVIPARTVRVMREGTKPWEAGARYIQQRFNKKRHFAELGNNVDYAEVGFNPVTARVDEFPGPSLEARQNFIRFSDRLFKPDNLKSVSKPEQAASEMVALNRRPLTVSETYGTPAGISAFNSMLALQKIENYNLDFFGTKGVPQYAVILKKLSKPRKAPIKNSDGTVRANADPMAQTRAAIGEFFAKKLTMGNRSVLTLQLIGDTEVKFERLSSDKLEASFAEYEARAREMIRLAHRMPPAALGIVETANLGSGRDTSQMRRYRDHIVVPGQRDMASMVNLIVRVGLLVPYFKFEFEPITLEEETALREYYLKVAKGGFITEDELLSRVPGGFDIRGEGGGGDRRIVHGSVTLLGESDPVVNDAALALDYQRKRWELAQRRMAADLRDFEDEE